MNLSPLEVLLLPLPPGGSALVGQGLWGLGSWAESTALEVAWWTCHLLLEWADGLISNWLGWLIAWHLTGMTAVKLKSAPKWLITGGTHKEVAVGKPGFNFGELSCCLLFIRPVLIYLGPRAWGCGSSCFSSLNDIFPSSHLTFLPLSAPNGHCSDFAQPGVLMWAHGLPSEFHLINSDKCMLSNYLSKKCRRLPWELTTRHLKISSSIISLQSNLIR